MPATQPARLAFHGQQAIKDEYLYRLEAHRAAGDLMQDYASRRAAGPAQEDARAWHGSALYGLVHTDTDPHGAAETQLGLPRVLARLLEEFFRHLSPARYSAWPVQFLQAIPVGADLAGVWPQLAVWLLVGESGLLRFVHTASQRKAIEGVATLCQKVLVGGVVPRKAWLKAEKAADTSYILAPFAAATTPLIDSVDTKSAICMGPYAEVYAAIIAFLHTDIDLAYAYANAQITSHIISTASDIATYAVTYAATGAIQDPTAASAASAIMHATYVFALADPTVAVRAAAHYLVPFYGTSIPSIEKDFGGGASTGYYDDLADRLLALLAAAPVPTGPASA